MNSQNILKFYGSRLDLRLDSSEYYDYELAKVDTDFDQEGIDFTTQISYPSLILTNSCMNDPLDVIKPWEIPINTPYTADTCNFTVRKRTEKGWTLDFVFNRNSLPWSDGSVFYYWGIKDETEEQNYLDNNLSFQFTDDGRVLWVAHHLSGYCQNSGYTETPYIASGQTGVLCSGGTSSDFNLSIVFQRNFKYENCDLLNQGGSNDYITGYSVTNIYSVITGDTEIKEQFEVLNKNWLAERNKRLGTLKIYLNGRKIYQINNWEEIVPSTRESLNPIVQIWGGGTTNSGGSHSGTTLFELKRVKYWEEPLNYVRIKQHYLSSTKSFYSINECVNYGCVDTVSVFSDSAYLHEDGDYVFSEDNDVLIY
jgi:hypothetical protein